MEFWKKILGQKTVQNVQSKTLSISEAGRMLKRTNELANVANKTTDRKEFYRSINEIKSILKELSKYEGKLPFIGSPSDDLRNLERMEQSQIELLEKRIKEKEKSKQSEHDFQFDEPDIKEYHIAKNERLDELDCYIADAGRFIIEKDKASIGMIQRNFKIGFNRAMRIMDVLEDMGAVGAEEGTAPRKILVTREEYENIVENYHPKTTPESKETNYIQERISLYNNQYDYMEGHDFEHFCAELLKKNGFANVEVTQGSGDQGIDVLAIKDGIKYGIQCKCYSSDIGNKAVQEVFSGKTFYNCHVGVVLTNRYFTASAKELAEKSGVLLWDRDKLNEMIKFGRN